MSLSVLMATMIISFILGAFSFLFATAIATSDAEGDVGGFVLILMGFACCSAVAFLVSTIKLVMKLVS